MIKMTTKIVIQEGKKIPENPIVIEGFPSKGLVSTIATKYMIDELGMDAIGYIESDRMQSVAIVHNSKPMHPVRIYTKDKLVLIFSELVVPITYVSEFSKVIDEWFEDIKPEQVLLLAGISGIETKEEHEILGIATTKELEKKLNKLDVRRIEEGLLTGISSDILLKCIEKNIPVISLMAETRYMPDPLAAASMLKILNSLLNLDIETKNLIEQGKKIEEMFKEIADQIKHGKDSHKRINEFYPMYG